MSLRFVVTGSGRSGTAQAAALFNQLGIPCGHEAVFGQPPPHAPLLGESSFLAVPHLATFRGLVFHQVRHPVDVIASIASIGFFERPGEYVAHLATIEATLPAIADRASALEKAMYYVLAWNERIEPRADVRWALERLTPAELARATVLIGEPRSPAECRTALASITTPRNRLEDHGIPRRRLTWGDLPPGPDREGLEAMARRYGYSDSSSA